MKFAAVDITSIPVSCSIAANCSGETMRPLHLRWLNRREGASRPPPFDPYDDAPRGLKPLALRRDLTRCGPLPQNG